MNNDIYNRLRQHNGYVSGGAKYTRKAKNWKAADEIRDKIFEDGWIVEDGPYGPSIKPK